MRDKQGRLIHPCGVEGCDRFGRGRYCGAHAQRLRATGELGPAKLRRRIPSNTPVAERIDIIGWTVDEEGCWIWNGRLDEYGYGRVDDLRQVPVRVHRASYERAHGVTLSRDVYLMHSCDKPACINPEHLSPGTQKENIRDMWSKGRARPWGKLQQVAS